MISELRYYRNFPFHTLKSFSFQKFLRSDLKNVFLELKRRGYDVYIGKNGNKEIDFIAIRRSEKIYIQVCVQLPENSDREIANSTEIKDNYPKYIITLLDIDLIVFRVIY